MGLIKSVLCNTITQVNLMTCMVCNELIILEHSYVLQTKDTAAYICPSSIVEHHISYFPEVSITIHKKCHSSIKLKKLGLIKYTNAEYKFFYEDLRYLDVTKLPFPRYYKVPTWKEKNRYFQHQDPRHNLLVMNKGYF